MWHHKQVQHFIAALMASALAGLVGQANYASASLPDMGERADYARQLPDAARYPVSEVTGPAYFDLALQRASEAKQARNAVISAWLGALHQAGLADYSVLNLDKGLIYAVRLKGHAGRDGLTAMWVAVPDGLDLPSSVLLRGSRMDAGAQPALELQSCTAHETLADGVQGLPIEEVEARAVSRLDAYLKAPDPMLVTAMGGARDTCRQLARMLPSLAQ